MSPITYDVAADQSVMSAFPIRYDPILGQTIGRPLSMRPESDFRFVSLIFISSSKNHPYHSSNLTLIVLISGLSIYVKLENYTGDFTFIVTEWVG
jgi:hypothetical protein